MFYQEYENILETLNKTFLSKKTIQDAAQQFAELEQMQKTNNPFQFVLLGFAHQGQMICYQKLEDKQRAIKSGLLASRFFLKSAEFNYEISRLNRETWSYPLSNAIQCYKTTIQMLKDDKKPVLTVNIMNELAEAEIKFSYHHYAANIYEEIIEFCFTHKLRLRLLFNSCFSAIQCYLYLDNLKFARALIKTFFSQYDDNGTRPNATIRNVIRKLQITKHLLDIWLDKFDATMLQDDALEEPVQDILLRYALAVSLKQIDRTSEIIDEIRNNKEFFEDFHVEILEKH